MTAIRSQAGFTPGPWKLELGDPPCIVGHDGETVVDLPMWIPEYRAERDANARLIAAAPALYEALRDCHMRLQTACDFNNAADKAALAKGAAALKQARGEA